MSDISQYLKESMRSIKSVLFVHDIDKFILPSCLIYSVVSTLLPYVEFLFVAQLIDAIIMADTNILAWVFIIFLTATLGLGVLKDTMENIIAYKAKRLEKKMMGLIQDQVMKINYEMMEDPQILKMISDAEYAMEHLGGYFSFIKLYCDLLESILLVCSTIVFTIYLCLITIAPTANSGTLLLWLSSPLVTATLLTGAILVNVIFTQHLAQKSRIDNVDLFKEKAIVERNLNYFTDNVFLNYGTSKDIRIFNMSSMFLHHHQQHMQRAITFFKINYLEKELKYDTLQRIGEACIVCLSYFLVGLKVYLGAISIGEFTSYVGIISLFSGSLSKIIRIMQKIKLQGTFTQAFTQLLLMDAKEDEFNSDLGILEGFSDYEFEFHNVSFKYKQSEDFTLQNISCKIRSGSKTAVVGPNGAGKSTFIKLLCRLYEPTEGYISLNGIDIREFVFEEYKQILAVVFQDFNLFSLPIKENVAGSTSVDDAHLLSALRLAGIEDRVSRMSKGTDTYLYHYNEDGVNISGGEAQKLAIARALYKDSPIIIMDEPVASLDPISEYEHMQQ